MCYFLWLVFYFAAGCDNNNYTLPDDKKMSYFTTSVCHYFLENILYKQAIMKPAIRSARKSFGITMKI
jgi:hypothetical protein